MHKEEDINRLDEKQEAPLKSVSYTHLDVYKRQYLCNCDFKKRVNKRGIEYGWDVAVYSSIEHIYGYDYVTSCYKDNPQDSWKQLVDYMHEMFPDATDKQIRKVLK